MILYCLLVNEEIVRLEYVQVSNLYEYKNKIKFISIKINLKPTIPNNDLIGHTVL